MVHRVRWEEDGFGEGPVGEYVEVVDYDSTVRKFYSPVDRNNPYIIANNGLTPRESTEELFLETQVVALLCRSEFCVAADLSHRPLVAHGALARERDPKAPILAGATYSPNRGPHCGC